MDLSKFSLSQISSRYSNLREYLADVLEGERHLIEDDTQQTEKIPFEVSSDSDRLEKTLASIRGASAPRVLEVLAPYFEAGFALKVKPNSKTARVHAMFLQGQFFETSKNQVIEAVVGLGAKSIEGVLKARTEPVLRALRLDNVESLQDCDVFAFQPTKDLVFLLIDKRPPVWQIGVLESAYFGAREALMDVK